MVEFRAPYYPDKLINFIVRTVPNIDYAGPWVDASEAENGNVVVWTTYDSQPDMTLQGLIGTTHLMNFHIGSKQFSDAQQLAGQVWAAILNAPTKDTSQVDGSSKIIAVRTNDSPVENRSQGQHLNFTEFRFSAYVTVGPATY